MPIYIYPSFSEYYYRERYSSIDVMPLKIYGNCPFQFDFINKKLLIVYNKVQIEEEYYSYETLSNKILIFKES